jgi:adenylylsulfate kinase
VYASAPLETCEARDVKGLYKKARAGQIAQFTGVSDPYEAPERPELVVATHEVSVEEGIESILQQLRARSLA